MLDIDLKRNILGIEARLWKKMVENHASRSKEVIKTGRVDSVEYFWDKVMGDFFNRAIGDFKSVKEFNKYKKLYKDETGSNHLNLTVTPYLNYSVLEEIVSHDVEYLYFLDMLYTRNPNTEYAKNIIDNSKFECRFVDKSDKELFTLAQWDFPDQLPEDYSSASSRFQSLFYLDDCYPNIVYLDEEAVGSSNLYIEDTSAFFASAKTISSMRNQGVQKLMIASRIELAIQHGVTDFFCTAITNETSATHTNFEKFNFKPLEKQLFISIKV